MQNGAMGHEQGLSSTANYTLPGIMQYLQSQFTQVERNRLQGELERSSLKLKIIELENERNSLLRKTARLQLTVDQMSEELDDLKGTKTKDAKENNTTTNTGKIKSDSEVEQILGGIHSLDVSKLIHARKFLKSATNEILYLLKTPTVELENTTSVGSITGIPSLTGGDNDNDLFFNYNTLSNMAQSNPNANGNARGDTGTRTDIDSSEAFEKPNVEKELNEILAAPFKSVGDSSVVESDAETIIDEPIDEKKSHTKRNNGVNGEEGKISDGDGDGDDDFDDDEEEEDEDDEFDDEFDDDEFDDDDDDDDEDDDENDAGGSQNLQTDKAESKNNLGKRSKTAGSQHGKNQKEKLLSLLKKSPKKVHDHSTHTLSVKLHPHLSEMELKSGRLFTYYDKANIVKIYDDLLGKGNLIKEVQLQDANTIVDIITNENFIVIATTDSLIAYTINSVADIKITKAQSDAKSIDLDKNKILLVSNSHIDVLEINVIDGVFGQLSSIEYHYEGTLKKAKFVKNNPSFDVAVLSSNTLYLYNTDDIEKKSKLFKSIPLNQYHEWLVTSRNMILRFNHGLYLFDFKECSEFKQVPLPSLPDAEVSPDSISEVISPCVDDDTMFYVTRCVTAAPNNKSTGLFELRLFKVIDTGDVLEVKSLTNMSGSERYCVGKIGDEFSICVARGREIHLYNITK